MIVVLGILTFGISVYLYIRCRQRNMINDLENSSVNELGIEQNNKEKNKYDEISVDNEKEFSYTDEIISDKAKMKREERNKRLGNLENVIVDHYSNQDKALDIMIENSRAISGHLQNISDHRDNISDNLSDMKEILDIQNKRLEVVKNIYNGN